MPVTLKILGGGIRQSLTPPCSFVFTRKKNRESKPPRSADNVSWRWNSHLPARLVFRSPVDPEVWVTAKERDALIAEHLALGWAFKNRKSFALVAPKPATIGWLKLNGDSRRFKYQHSDFGWNRVFEHRDGGF